MRKFPIIAWVWLVLIVLPLPLYFSMYSLGLIGLAAYMTYYMPLWFLEEPFFVYSSDIGWWIPTIWGNVAGLTIYSILLFLIYRWAKWLKS